jgi:hypothetical protein
LQGTIKFPTTYVGIPESLTLDIGVLHPTSPTEVQVLDASDVAIENNGINLVYSVVEDTTGLFTDGLNGGGLMIVPTTGIIIGTPKKGKTGTFSIKVTPGATSEYKNASAITCTAIKVTVRHDKIEFKTNSLISNNQN